MVVLFAQPPALAVAVQTGNRFAAAAHNLQFIDIIDHIGQPGHGCSRLVTAFIAAPVPAGDEHQTNRSNHGQRQDSQCFSVHGAALLEAAARRRLNTSRPSAKAVTTMGIRAILMIFSRVPSASMRASSSRLTWRSWRRISSRWSMNRLSDRKSVV